MAVAKAVAVSPPWTSSSAGAASPPLTSSASAPTSTSPPSPQDYIANIAGKRQAVEPPAGDESSVKRLGFKPRHLIVTAYVAPTNPSSRTRATTSSPRLHAGEMAIAEGWARRFARSLHRSQHFRGEPRHSLLTSLDGFIYSSSKTRNTAAKQFAAAQTQTMTEVQRLKHDDKLTLVCVGRKGLLLVAHCLTSTVSFGAVMNLTFCILAAEVHRGMRSSSTNMFYRAVPLLRASYHQIMGIDKEAGSDLQLEPALKASAVFLRNPSINNSEGLFTVSEAVK